ncbi:hypothetical protein [Arthrobacter sp. MMS18-M83]|uniref:hypothetical protein n=1 Tax=Arthrobacter sp. MMS18-M83 TaxID=2996261 RepID=UPI00227C7E36|nr:hypothetical protein [Arthrobacter sp. MMS18-M83]WAH99716.1 hypothetical protein OW521_12960 [Arthrobacter sp. MMS18-M83]
MHGQPRAAPVEVKPHSGAAPAVFEGVREAFLDNPEDGELLTRAKLNRDTGLALLDLEASLAHSLHKGPDVGEPGLRGDQAVVAHSFNDALCVHQGVAGRHRDVLQGVEHCFRLVLWLR